MKQTLLPKWPKLAKKRKKLKGGGGWGIEHIQSFNPCICLEGNWVAFSSYYCILWGHQSRILIVLFSFPHLLVGHLLPATTGTKTFSPTNQHCSHEAHPAEAIFRRKLVCMFFVCLCWGGGGSQVVLQPQVPWGGGTPARHVPNA